MAVWDDDDIAREIVRQCLQRGPDKSICPSEVSRALAAGASEWRSLMPEVRRVADILAREGRIRVLQRGKSVSALTARGPIRLSLCMSPQALKAALRRIGGRDRRQSISDFD